MKQQLEAYLDLVEHWNTRIRLVAPAARQALRHRHIDDSLQLIALLPKGVEPIWDIGSGAGFPGIVLAIALPQREVHLVESDRRKVAFLLEAKRVLGLAKLSVTATRAESLPASSIRVLTARALAPLDRLLPLTAPLMALGGTAIFPKGRNVEAELRAASRTWTMAIERFPSRTDPEGTILRLRDIMRHTDA